MKFDPIYPCDPFVPIIPYYSYDATFDLDTFKQNDLSKCKQTFCYFSDSTDARIEMMSPAVSDIYYTLLPFLYGLTHVSKVGSVFTTLAVSLERYFAVCRPLWIRIRRCHPAMYIILVTVFAFAFNIPKFLEFEVSFQLIMSRS